MNYLCLSFLISKSTIVGKGAQSESCTLAHCAGRTERWPHLLIAAGTAESGRRRVRIPPRVPSRCPADPGAAEKRLLSVGTKWYVEFLNTLRFHVFTVYLFFGFKLAVQLQKQLEVQWFYIGSSAVSLLPSQSHSP